MCCCIDLKRQRSRLLYRSHRLVSPGGDHHRRAHLCPLFHHLHHQHYQPSQIIVNILIRKYLQSHWRRPDPRQNGSRTSMWIHLFEHQNWCHDFNMLEHTRRIGMSHFVYLLIDFSTLFSLNNSKRKSFRY